MAKVNYGYKYKPTAAGMFKPSASSATPTNTKQYLETQSSNLAKRFEGVGIDSTKPQGELDKRNLIEKALNLTPQQGPIMDILEVLDRPREVVANVLSSLGESDKRNVLEAAWEGLAGKEKLSTREALQNLTGDDSFLELEQNDKSYWDEIGNFVVNVGLDIVSDPTTYLPGGFLLKQAGKAGGAIGKVGGSLIDAAKASKNLTLKSAGEATESFVKGVSKKLDDISYLFSATKGITDEQVRAIKKISGEAGKTADDLKVAIKDVEDILKATGVKQADKIAKDIIENGTELIKNADGTWRAVTTDGKVVMDDIIRQFYDDIKKRPLSPENMGKVAEKIINVNVKSKPAVKKILDNIVEALNKVTDKKLFSLRVGDKGSVALQFQGSADEFANILKSRNGITDPEVLKILSDTVIDTGKRELLPETLEALAKHGEAFKSATDKLRGIQENTRKFLQQMGEFDVGGKSFESGVEYMRRVVSTPSEEFLKSSKFYATDFVKPGTSDLASRTYEGTSREINAALKDLYGATDDLFSESALASVQDLVNVAQKRYTQTNLTKMFLGMEYDSVTKTYKKAADAPEFFFQIGGKTTGDVAEQLPSGFQVLKKPFKEEFSNLFKNLPDEMKKALNDDFLEVLGAANQDGLVAMQKSAYNIFKNADNAYKEIPEFLKVYDDLLGKWKSVTLLSPGFHGRNFVGNASNMYLAGMNTFDIIRYQSDAIKDLMKYKKLSKLRTELGEQGLKQADKIFLNNFDEIAKSGVLTGHRGARDLDDVKKMIDRLDLSGNLKDKNIAQRLVESNFNFAEEIDDIQRIALYQWALKKNGNSAAAFKQVREALFDYTLLTPFERNTMKRAVPFYTFMKNNLVFQSKNILQNPNQYAKLLRGYKHWAEGMTDMDINELPDYMTNNMWLPIPMIVQRGDEESINFLKLNLPPADFAELIENPFNKGVN